LDAWLRDADIVINPIDARQTELARFAFLVYGKGRHPARLNLGDCFSYAAAKALNAPLLFVGNDFAQTDVRVA
jgi:ribonuclease VapC